MFRYILIATIIMVAGCEDEAVKERQKLPQEKWIKKLVTPQGKVYSEEEIISNGKPRVLVWYDGGLNQVSDEDGVFEEWERAAPLGWMIEIEPVGDKTDG